MPGENGEEGRNRTYLASVTLKRFVGTDAERRVAGRDVVCLSFLGLREHPRGLHLSDRDWRRRQLPPDRKAVV